VIKKDKVLIVLSDIISSDLLVSIISRLDESMEVEIVLLGKKNSSIHLFLISASIKVTVFEPKSSFPSIAFLNVLLLKRLLQSTPGLIYASGLFATYSTILTSFLSKNIPMVYTRHHSNAHWSKRRVHWKFLDFLSFKVARRVFAVSNVVKDCLIKEGCQGSKIQVITNGIRLDRFSAVREKRKTPHPERRYRIGVVARLEEWKGVQLTLEALLELSSSNFAKPTGFELWLAGSHYQEVSSRLQTLLKLAREREIIKEIPWQIDMSEFYSSIDVLIHVPTSASVEAFGMVYIEALAAGVPSIFTQSGILNNLLNLEQYFTIVDYCSSHSIQSALQSLYCCSQENHQMVPLEFLKDFDLNQCSLNYQSSINEILLRNY
jgi:glycosyltransferase involved in cell wall biosynthesis